MSQNAAFSCVTGESKPFAQPLLGSPGRASGAVTSAPSAFPGLSASTPAPFLCPPVPLCTYSAANTTLTSVGIPPSSSAGPTPSPAQLFAVAPTSAPALPAPLAPNPFPPAPAAAHAGELSAEITADGAPAVNTTTPAPAPAIPAPAAPVHMPVRTAPPAPSAPRPMSPPVTSAQLASLPVAVPASPAVTDLRVENAKLKSQLQTVPAALTQLKEAESRWRSATDMSQQLRADLSEAERQKQLLSDTAQFRQKQAYTAFQKLREAEGRVNETVKTVEEKEAELKSAAEENATLSEAVQFRHRQAWVAWQKMQQLQAQLDETTSNLECQKEKLRSSEREVQRLSGLEKHLQALEAEVVPLRIRSDALTDLEKRHATVCQEKEQLRSQLAAAEKQQREYCEQAQAYYNSANGEVTALRQKVRRSDTAEVEVAQKQVELDAAKAEIASLKALLKEADETRARLDQFSKLTDELAQARLQIANNSEAAGRACDEANASLGAAHRRITKLELEIQGLQADLELSRNQLAQTTERARLSQEQAYRLANDRTVDDLRIRLQDAEQRICQLTEALEESRSKADNLKSIASSAQNDVARLQTELRVATEQVNQAAALRSTVAANEKEFEIARKAYLDQKRQIEELRRQVVRPC
eukprot:RCo028920